MQITEDYHVHVYFDAASKQTAQEVFSLLSDTFQVAVGHFHDRPVGPHPIGSCQVTVAMDNFGEVIDWLAKNRRGLTIFIHANTGDVMKDHMEHTIWMGEMMALNLEVLRRLVAVSSD
jgi:DOPA 4,5-dioxygenase